ncbi:hypothetical protein P0O15_02900 [Methanotrichaceae archaeon Mx]|uniref:Uncharacterized protein n=1 Tax=Candidatus Methanocrinis natronophilus TaxID=3033396 RepID=A0ABT5X6B0_9EURY|nr:hypothetical protein [Candidatus Methanocrinis natronophilus]
MAVLIFIKPVLPFGLRFRELQVRIHRCTGKTFRWLGTSWRVHGVVLADVVILYAVVMGSFRLLINEIFGNVFSNSTIYNLTLNGPISPGADFSLMIFDANKNGSLHYVNLNGTVIQGFLQETASLSGGGSIENLSAAILATLLLDWKNILILWIVIEIAMIVSDASQRLVVEDVSDYTQDPPQDQTASKPKADWGSKRANEGLSDLFIVHLNRINELYKIVDEERAIPSDYGAGKPIDANIKAEDLSYFLNNEAVGESQEISFFGMKIPPVP